MRYKRIKGIKKGREKAEFFVESRHNLNALLETIVAYKEHTNKPLHDTVYEHWFSPKSDYPTQNL